MAALMMLGHTVMFCSFIETAKVVADILSTIKAKLGRSACATVQQAQIVCSGLKNNTQTNITVK